LQGDYEASLGYWSGRIDPDDNMYAFLHSGALLNEGHSSNPAFDSLLDQARRVADVDTWRGIYAKACQWGRRICLSAAMEERGRDVSEDARFRAPIPEGQIRIQGLQLAHCRQPPIHWKPRIASEPAVPSPAAARQYRPVSGS